MSTEGSANPGGPMSESSSTGSGFGLIVAAGRLEVALVAAGKGSGNGTKEAIVVFSRERK